MEWHGIRGLLFKDEEESRFFEQSTKLTGHHWNLVRHCYDERAHAHLKGATWNDGEKGKSQGYLGLSLLYATIDPWYLQWGVQKKKFTEAQIEETRFKYGSYAKQPLPLSDQELLDLWRLYKRPKVEKPKEKKPAPRRTKTYDKKNLAGRNPAVVFNRIASGFPNRTMLDEEILRQIAGIIADGRELSFQADNIKDGDGLVPMESLQDFTKLMDQIIKLQQAASNLMKQHGYDYGTRKRTREAATAAEIFADVASQAEALFESRATEIVCRNCKLSFGYLVRHFITVEYNITVVKCPRCKHDTTIVMEAQRDELELG